MPYILPEKRAVIDQQLDKILARCEFDDHLFQIDDNVLANAIRGLLSFHLQPRSYRRFNEIVGMLECCRLELIRKMPSTGQGGEYYTVISKDAASMNLRLHELNYLPLLKEDVENLAGNLNYIITKVIHTVMSSGVYRPTMGPAAVLAWVKERIYLEEAAPYEDEKEQENGPVTISEALRPTVGKGPR